MAERGKREERLRELLLLWDEARERGEDIGIETLCEGCPELIEELRQRADALRDWERLAGPTTGSPLSNGESQAQEPPRVPESPDVSLPLRGFEYHARGGLGVIFKAQQKDLQRDVAVKFLDELAVVPRGESRQRFLREAWVTARLEHPGIVPVYGLGHDAAGRPCYAMRFIKGKTLKAEIVAYHSARSEDQGRRRFSLARDPDFRALLQRFKAACTTVAFAHDQGFLHRDLKPDNIMLGLFDETLVVDWGLAKQIGSSRDSAIRVEPAPEWDQALSADHEQFSLCTEGSIGTLGFASPEQQAGQWDRVGPASDIFSLGATLFFLLTGQFAFKGSSSAELAASVERGVSDAPSRVDRRVPRELEAVCLKALAGSPEDRYATALELANDLEAWMADRPVSAMPDPWTTRAWRWVNRHRTLVVTATAVLIVGLTLARVS
jgi:eukaryotic-like serine/threonine-protein kinase